VETGGAPMPSREESAAGRARDDAEQAGRRRAGRAVSLGLHGLDYAALAVFIGCWLGTASLIERHARRKPGVHDLMRPLRMEWMRQAQLRDIRIADAGLIGQLIHSATFFRFTWSLRQFNLVTIRIAEGLTGPQRRQTTPSPC